jgi:hypothetical protein
VNLIRALPVPVVVLMWHPTLWARLSLTLLHALPVMLRVLLLWCVMLQVMTNVNSVHALQMPMGVLLWCAALQASTQALPVFVETVLNTRPVRALPALVVTLWRARPQATLNANSVQALPAVMVMLPWRAALQAILSVTPIRALPETVAVLL